MRDLAGFRAAVRGHRRLAGRTQQQLARAIGLQPNVLSHKLHGHNGAVLTAPEVIGIVTTLAGWGALASRAEAEALLDFMAVPPQALPPSAWTAPPLAGLAPQAAGPARPPRAAAAAEAGPGPGQAAPGRVRLAPLPAPGTALIGRETERAEVAAALTASRLVTLTGAGGTGKTRLAVQVARDVAARFCDGVAFADLAPVSDPVLMATAVAAALGLVPPSTGAAEDHVTSALAGKNLLLVLDNLEQLVERAGLLARWLAAAPAVRMLVTSRIALCLYAEHTLRVPPLRLPAGDRAGSGQHSEAVRLFLARAQAARHGFAPGTAELAAIGQICTALDGLPLAIELAAARIRLYPPQALLALLESRLTVLTGGPRDLPARQQTLRATLEWSEALLPSAGRALFARLGVFAGPFDTAAAAAVCGDAVPAGGMLEALATLGDHSLLEVLPGDPPRFRLLQTIREYALARLAESGQAAPVHQRHLHHYLALATQARAGLHGPERAAWASRIEAGFASIRAALDWASDQAEAAGPHDDGGCLEQALRLASAVAPVWQSRGSLAEGALHLERLLAIDTRLRSAAPATRARALLEASVLACFRGDCPHTTALAAEALALFEALGDLPGQAWAHRYLGEAALTGGDYTTAEPHFTRQLTLSRHAGDRRGEADACNNLAQILRYQGRYAAARARLRQALRSFQAARDPDLTATVLGSLGEVARDAGHPARAHCLFRQAMCGHQQAGNHRKIAYDLEGLAGAAALLHQPRAALVYLGAAQAIREATGGPQLPPEQAILTRLLGPALACLSEGERDDALADGRNRPLAEIIAQALGEEPPNRANHSQSLVSS